jgi:2-methylcitrate dehydratase PrpD
MIDSAEIKIHLSGGVILNDVTSQIAHYVVDTSLDQIPLDVRKEARRALLNFVGCALGGADHEAMQIILEALGPVCGVGQAHAIGRVERVDPLLGALLNGVSSHVHDYDDTTPNNYIHASSPVASALFSYASVNKLTGAELELAFILGFEAMSRVGNAMYPSHYDAGWHSTGTMGSIGAAVGIGKLLKLSPKQMIRAIGLGATQSSGLREMFGSMAKSFHPGRSAQSGYIAALLSKHGFTAGMHGLEGPRGLLAVQAVKADLPIITHRLGEEFALRVNTYKPFPCGLVIHPIIDACIQLREQNLINPSDIARVRLRVAPLVKDLCDKKDISTGLEGKFSAYHAAAIGLQHGKAGLAEFTDEIVNDIQTSHLRNRVETIADQFVAESSVRVEVDMVDGQRYSMHLDHAIGDLTRPLSDKQLESKFRAQAMSFPVKQVDELLKMCWGIEQESDVGRMVQLSIPFRN